MASERFIINAPRLDRDTATIRFGYTLGTHVFTETIAFPALAGALPDPLPAAFDHLLDLTAAVLGVSYYKLRAPTQIDANALGMSESDRAFVLDVYENGLGEFFARNDLKRFGRLALETGALGDSETPAPALDAKALVLIGGGKDSLVSLQLLEAAGVAMTLFAVNPKGPIKASAERAGLPLLAAERKLDPEMIALSKTKGYYNGHVPSTAINSMIASLVALLTGHDRIVLSNERSASQGNLAFDGREANHQHSKSLAFERHMQATLARATAGALGYFSLLRPFSEARIAALFTRQTRFDAVFSSCNRNFTQIPHQGPLWCCNCPKCHFVFLIFAPVMARDRLVGIFGADVLDDETAIPAFRELTGLSGHKPWECVGEILEAAACLWRIAEHPDWREAAVVDALRGDLAAFYGGDALETAYAAFMTDSAEHDVPEPLASAMARHAV